MPSISIIPNPFNFMQPALPTDGYTCGVFNTHVVHTTAASAVLTDTSIWAVPMVIGRTLVIKAMAVVVETLDAGNFARLGLYYDLNGLPGALLVDAGTVALDATGFVATSNFTNREIPPGLYWGAVVSDSAATAKIRPIAQADATPVIKHDGTNPFFMVTKTVVAAAPPTALPANFGTPDSYSSGLMHKIFLKGA